jgi:hypothetical protein
VFDLGADLYLLEQIPLPRGPFAPPQTQVPHRRIGGSVHVRGDLVFVVEPDGIVVFRGRP